MIGRPIQDIPRKVFCFNIERRSLFIHLAGRFVLEAMFHHISNAGLAEGRNRDLNSFGGIFGLSYFTDRSWK